MFGLSLTCFTLMLVVAFQSADSRFWPVLALAVVLAVYTVTFATTWLTGRALRRPPRWLTVPVGIIGAVLMISAVMPESWQHAMLSEQRFSAMAVSLGLMSLGWLRSPAKRPSG